MSNFNEKPIGLTIKRLAKKKKLAAAYFVGKIRDVDSASGIYDIFKRPDLDEERIAQFEKAMNLEPGDIMKAHNSGDDQANELMEFMQAGFDRLMTSEQEQIKFLQKQIEQKDKQLNQAHELIGTFMPYMGSLLGKPSSELEPASGKVVGTPKSIGFVFPAQQAFA